MNRTVVIHDPRHRLGRCSEIWRHDVTIHTEYVVHAHRVAAG